MAPTSLPLQIADGGCTLLMSPPDSGPVPPPALKFAPLTISRGAVWLSPTGAPRRCA